MQAADIPTLAAWLAATDIGLLELRGPGTALRLRQGAGGVQVEPLQDELPTATTVAAPSVGVFLRRHPLRSDDLAPPGTAVVAGQALGLLQIGPLLRPVAAPKAGLVLDTLVSHGTAVGYGTPLFTLADAP